MSGMPFRGTSLESDGRYGNGDKKLIDKMTKEGKFAIILNNKIDLKKINIPIISNWVTERLLEILGFEDDIVTGLVINFLQADVIDGKRLQLDVTGFLEKQAGSFVEELWQLLIDAQQQPSGIPSTFIQKKKEEILKRNNDKASKFEDKKSDNDNRGQDRGDDNRGRARGDDRGRDRGDDNRGRDRGDDRGREKGDDRGRERGDDKGREKGGDRRRERGDDVKGRDRGDDNRGRDREDERNIKRRDDKYDETRDKGRQRSRSPDRHRRSRSRDRYRRSRSRDRYRRSRSPDRYRRSRSPHRYRRSRSRSPEKKGNNDRKKRQESESSDSDNDKSNNDDKANKIREQLKDLLAKKQKEKKATISDDNDN